MRRRLKRETLWVAVDDGGRVQSVWRRESGQSFADWRREVTALGWRVDNLKVRQAA